MDRLWCWFCLFMLHIENIFALDLSGGQCGQPEVPENGHVVFHNSGPITVGVTVSYKCDVGFILIGPDKRICENGGTWSEHAPVCAINVALYKPSFQSSTHEVEAVLQHANYSTDGNFDGICSSTKAVNTNEDADARVNGDRKQDGVNWWRVDLLEMYKVYAVELLIPSSQSNKSELNQIEIYAYADLDDVEEKGTICYKHKGYLETNQLHTFVCQKETYARHIKIVSGSASPLRLCEVVVLSTAATTEWQCGGMSRMDWWGVLDGKCIYGSTEVMPWFSASTHCQMNTASLVYDTNEQLHRFLSTQAKYRAAKNAQHYWLGLTMGGNREWTWINGKPTKNEFWANTKWKDVTVTNMAYSAAMAQSAGWNWVPSLQTLWYNWICQSKPRFCSSPGIPQNGGVMLSTQMYTIGASSYYYCNYGYSLKGPESRTCLENGTWSGRVPRCVVVDCGKADAPFGLTAKYTNDSTLVGSKVDYECPEGRKIVGVSSRTCLPDGTWSDTPPKCTEVDCGWPDEVANGRVYIAQNSTKIDSVAEWTCLAGYGLIGPNVRHCAPSGQWTPVQTPYCYDINSVRAPLPQANADGWHHSSLMTGFVVAVVVLLLVVLVVLVWNWRRKKTLDSLSMSTLYAAASSQLAAAAASASSGHPEVLYAFPSIPTAQRKEDTPHYYVPSLIDTAHDSTSVKSIQCNGSERKFSCLSVDELCSDYPQRTPIFLTKAPLMLAPPGDRLGSDQPVLLTPFHHDRGQMQKIINDIHLTLPGRRRGPPKSVLETKTDCPLSFTYYHTVRRIGPDANQARSIGSGAKTVGAAAGRRLNSVLTKVRRKISEVNLNFLNSDGRMDTDQEVKSNSNSTAPATDQCPTLRVNLARVVDQLNINRSKSVLSPSDQPGRSASPSASELFAFDDDDDDECDGGAAGCSKIGSGFQNSCDSGDSSGTAGLESLEKMIDAELRLESEKDENRKKMQEREEEDGPKIYDLPPDASALIYGNLAKALLKQREIEEENIYETPLDAARSDINVKPKPESMVRQQAKRLEQAGIQIVHTYC